MTWITLSIIGLLGLLLLAIGLTILLVLWPRRYPLRDTDRNADEYREREIQNGVVFEQTFPTSPARFDMPDGGHIAARSVGPEEARDIVVLVHGIGAAGARWTNPSGLLSHATGAQVIALDLRGHNDSSGPRYDVDHVGQYEDDIAEVIAVLQSDRPDARIWLAGHSMGGGIALRFALKKDRPRVAGYLLFAPIFGPGPTAPARLPDDSVLRISRGRMTGLMILNMLGLRALNHLKAAYLDAPPEFPAYSFRALASGLPLPPKTAEDAMDAMEAPFIIVAGEDDPTVRVDGYSEVVGSRTHGTVEILPGHGHDSILNDPATHRIVARWIDAVRTLSGNSVSWERTQPEPNGTQGPGVSPSKRGAAAT